MSGPNAPRTEEEWFDAYEERGNKYIIGPDEKKAFNPERGFFTYRLDAQRKEIWITQMCGDVRFWRPFIWKLIRETRHLGIKGLVYHTLRNPAAFMRLTGGTPRGVECSIDFQTGRTRLGWFIFISQDDAKQRLAEEENE
jgi:hypothetical protein